jgi:2-hydroxy-3-keto-5-methylthiopentenyl-1-phosphate phosphatase
MKLKNVYLSYNKYKETYTGTIGFGDDHDEVTFTLTESEAEDLSYMFRDRLIIFKDRFKSFTDNIEQSTKE